MPGVLIVDDNPSIRFILRSFVQKYGYSVCGEAGHGEESIEKAERLQPDLVLLDLAMPVMNGAEATSVLRRTLPNVNIILFSLHADGIGEALAAAVGADLVLSKTETVTKLGDHLKALLPTPVG